MIVSKIEEVVRERSLLKHSFYTRWVSGTLPREALQEYARQYFRFESAFPRVLSSIHTQLEDLADRQAVLDNLWDEEHGDESHSELWLRFAESVGVTREDVLSAQTKPATARLVGTYRELGASSAGEGLAALFAYEHQVPEVADAKIRGLESHYGVTDGRGLAFWRVHRTLDTEHAGAEAELLAKHADDSAVDAARRALEAWWEFLSEVESVAV